MTASSDRRPIVLLIENEPIQMMVLSDLIEEAGCDVVEATTTAKAIQILEHRGDIRVVVADLDVHGSVLGLQLAAMIRDRWPPVELILTGAVKPDLSSIPARGVFYDKPFDQGRLVQSIRSFVSANQ
ncbi:Response regulator receiver domain-containing protein [Methylobacterium phyllostachyos]|uniref:Response regulator receiver domain-containing protein n=1 Tax=Methylobacterium phyllostachyos TaxID=582672 RepID=A0A1G9VBK8_9HYPH|nr:response regulator [Methylobacterium phyllostachyos]SDM69511.1 Response regulator receiver domain-containing protein [Methylobacterium phyllostachyos]